LSSILGVSDRQSADEGWGLAGEGSTARLMPTETATTPVAATTATTDLRNNFRRFTGSIIILTFRLSVVFSMPCNVSARIGRAQMPRQIAILWRGTGQSQ
jgi:hypothetical protein